MFCGGLFIQAIGVVSNHVAKEVPVTLAKAKSTDHCHHATRWSNNGDDLKLKETRCNAPKTTTSRSSTSSDRFARSLCSHQSLHNLKGEQQNIFGYLEAL
jgi:hypothetical protein